MNLEPQRQGEGERPVVLSLGFGMPLHDGHKEINPFACAVQELLEIKGCNVATAWGWHLVTAWKCFVKPAGVAPPKPSRTEAHR